MVDEQIERVIDDLQDIAATDREQESSTESPPPGSESSPPAVVVAAGDDHVPELVDATVGEHIANFRNEVSGHFTMLHSRLDAAEARLMALESPPEPEVESIPEPIEPIESSPEPEPIENSETEPTSPRPRTSRPERSGFRHKFGSHQ